MVSRTGSLGVNRAQVPVTGSGVTGTLVNRALDNLVPRIFELTLDQFHGRVIVPVLLITRGLTFRILLQAMHMRYRKAGMWHEALGHRKSDILAVQSLDGRRR
jgi:hypothetical protein